MLLSRNRLFERKPATREARSIYIFCEGKRREKNYFDYFREMDSRINVEVYELNGEEDNSPLGLLEIAKRGIIKSEVNPNPTYTFQENDEVWIVLDTDPDQQESRKEQIDTVRREISNLDAWFVTESNPCFEVWLYYHFHENVDPFESSDICKTWKGMVNESISGGFDSRKHPLYVERATTNAEVNFMADDSGKLSVGSTEIFRLSKSFLPLIVERIRDIKTQLGL